MIQIYNVSKSYNKKAKALDNITLDIPNGQIFGFLGPNGAGKTTAIKLITGILSPDEGKIEVSGHDIIKNPLDAKQSFGYIPDDPNIFPRLKGIEYLNFIGDIYNVDSKVRVERIRSLSDKFALGDVLGDKIQSYSHGMRQKLLIIGALIHDPENWILDEPMTGLDPKSSHILKDMMRQHADEGKSVFFSTHVLEVAEKICDRLAIIDKGKLLFVGSVDQMKSAAQDKGSLESMFLELTGDNA